MGYHKPDYRPVLDMARRHMTRNFINVVRGTEGAAKVRRWANLMKRDPHNALELSRTAIVTRRVLEALDLEALAEEPTEGGV